MAANANCTNSTETILTFENRNVEWVHVSSLTELWRWNHNPSIYQLSYRRRRLKQSQWSVVWSTANVPCMDAGMGAFGPQRRASGRRRLRVGALALGALLTMHCRITASAISGGFFIFIMFLILAVVLLANPLRHFEVYLGQWSISGPGRAFRIIPMFDGIGLAMCINAIVRAITCCTMASISAVYVIHSVSDARLPFTYCRDFNLSTYEPALQDVKVLRNLEFPWFVDNNLLFMANEFNTAPQTTVGLKEGAWRNRSLDSVSAAKKLKTGQAVKIPVCKESYMGGYPSFFSTPPYNFFYVEVVQFRQDLSLKKFNIPLIINLVVAWIIIWAVLISEKISHGRLVWNNMYSWFLVVPWLWAAILALTVITNVSSIHKIMDTAFRLDSMDIISAIADALQVAMYIHSASTGTELIHGKGLNHYASGHIDTHLNSENIWHSGLVLLLAILNSTNTALCAMADFMQISIQEAHVLTESTLWIIPLYSKCTSTGSHSHLLSAVTFAGLTFSYMVVAYTLLKTALHTIFEYKVRLVFIEQVVVGILMLVCMGLSVLFATNGGIALLEGVDSIMTGVAMPLLCLQELAVMLWIYRNRDFVSDVNVATEDNTCPSRIGSQWQIVPFILLVTLCMKVSVLSRSELPRAPLCWALLPLGAVVAAVPLRAIYNAYAFLRPSKHVRP